MATKKQAATQQEEPNKVDLDLGMRIAQLEMLVCDLADAIMLAQPRDQAMIDKALKVRGHYKTR